jgi:chemotaxis protein methyltransferase CheR
MNDQEYSYLKNKIYKLTNLDINCYKDQQMRRRLDMFVAKCNYPTVIDYCKVLENNPDKQREFLDFMAINVSEFFRDKPQFNILQNFIIPYLIANSYRINIWSAACSCGQEPYSLAMILEETCPHVHHRILATDIDESALKQARNGGPYTAYDVRNVEKKFSDKYLIKNESGYWVDEKIKRKVIFQHHNILNDSFEQNYDLIICRNVIIYFSDVVRDNLYLKFNNSLKGGGVLFLGGSEVVLSPGKQGFSMLHPAFYQKSATPSDTHKVISRLSEVVK